MNYRHAFHAGNFADVHKHVVLLALLERLGRKPKPLFYMDTHAGRGWYDLRSHEAQRGAEWQDGIARLSELRAASPDLRRYLQVVSSAHEQTRADRGLTAPPPAGAANRTTVIAQPDSGAADRGVQSKPAGIDQDPSPAPLKVLAEVPQRYPGSPILALRQLREGDRIVFVERQIEEAHALDQAVRHRRGVSVVCGDGYAALKTYLPPRENRGLVLIDPPYEADHEFLDAQRALQFGMKRWPNGLYALWYPIKAGPDVQRLHAALQQSGLRKLLLLELMVRPADSPLGLNGSGLIVANPPWQFETEIAPSLAQLSAVLRAGVARSTAAGGQGAGRSRVQWLVPE